MSREITCSSVRPHLLAPVYTAVFRGKEAAFWLRSLSQRDLDTIVDDDDNNNNNNNNKNNNNNNHDNDDDSIDNNEINGNGNSMDILNWMLREKLIFHVTCTSKNLLSKIPNPINQIKIAGRKTPVKNVSIKPMVLINQQSHLPHQERHWHHHHHQRIMENHHYHHHHQQQDYLYHHHQRHL